MIYWNAWGILKLCGFVGPHKWILYIKTDRIIDSYIVSLLNGENFDLKTGLKK